eukprot:944315-Rhodomonas_salina.1
MRCAGRSGRMLCHVISALSVKTQRKEGTESKGGKESLQVAAARTVQEKPTDTNGTAALIRALVCLSAGRSSGGRAGQGSELRASGLRGHEEHFPGHVHVGLATVQAQACDASER